MIMNLCAKRDGNQNILFAVSYSNVAVLFCDQKNNLR